MIGPVFPRFSSGLSANLTLPTMVVGRLGETRGSCATGYDRRALVRSAGEALERQMSFGRMPPSKERLRLSELSEDASAWFRNLFQASDQPELDDWSFACVEARNLRTGDTLLVPSVPFTLAPHPDAAFMPIRDSSGCAIYPDEATALETAVGEFAERQGLTLFWYFGHLNHSVEITGSFADKAFDADTARLVRWFTEIQKGRVFLLDVSVIEPYRSLIAVYVSDQGEVHFAAGGSGNSDPYSAASKSIVELYQAFVLTYQHASSNAFEADLTETTDAITTGYLEFNSSSWAKKFEQIGEDGLRSGNGLDGEINWRVNAEEIDILAYRQKLSFGPDLPTLHYVSTIGMPAFPLMAIEGEATSADRMAAARYGYTKQIRRGVLPFA